MQYEVYVPFAVSSVRSALTEPERIARCVPGYQPDEPAASDASRSGTLTGRLRVRIGGSSITYRGSLVLTSGPDGLVVEGSGVEARGSGTVTCTLTVTARQADDGIGTVLDCSGTVKAEGRLTAYDPRQTAAAGRRLLDRFGAALAESLVTGDGGHDTPAADGAPDTPSDPASDPASDTASDRPADPASDAVPDTVEGLTAEGDLTDRGEPDATTPPTAGLGAPDDNEPVIPGIPAPDSTEPEIEALPPDTPGETPGDTPGEAPGETLGEGVPADPESPADGERSGLFEVEVPPPALDPLRDEDLSDPTAEAAHARRTMIGRSAEEVDHAPPRGRYAPVPAPAPRPTAARALRWALPVAAAVLASAVLARRVVRRRR